MFEGEPGAADPRGTVRSRSTSSTHRPPNETRAFVHKRIFGAVGGFITGGPIGAVSGFITGGSKGRPGTTRPSDSVPVVLETSRTIRRDIVGTGCVPPTRLDPRTGQCRVFIGSQSGRDPVSRAVAPVGPRGTAVVGSFGLPAMVPNQVGTIQRLDGSVGPIRRCDRGMVLGTDELCYPKAVLPRRSKFRKWPAAPRPTISAADTKAIRVAARARDRVLALAKDVGLHASKTKPTKSAPRQHQHLIAAPSPRVIEAHVIE